MKKILITISALALSATGVFAAAHLTGNPAVDARKALMQANGAAAGVAGAMMKGEMDYNAAVAKSAIATMRSVAYSLGSHFPADSNGVEGSKAGPKIWEDMGGFEATIAKFKADTDAAAAASGKDGPADLDAFKAAIGPVFGNCKGCHETYRINN